MLSDSKVSPLVYEISKIEDTFPCGTTKFTLKQDHYNPATDNSELRICDFYESPILPEEQIKECFSLKYSGTNPTLRIGGSSRTIYIDSEHDIDNVTWSYSFEGQKEISTDDFIIEEFSDHIVITAAKNFNNLGKVITITAKTTSHKDSISMEVKR